jgi:hypothetical protein
MARRPHLAPSPERHAWAPARLLRRVTRFEWVLAALAAVVLAGLVVAEPDILEAPFENGRTLGLTFGGTLLAAIALAAMLRWGVPAPLRALALGVPFVAVAWWTLSPFFIDDVVQDSFEVSIADALEQQQRPAADGPATTATTPTSAAPTTGAVPTTVPPTTGVTVPPAPRLLGAGMFVGLAGHDGTGDAAIFERPDASRVLRLENLDIDNGPDLRLYLLPGADQRAPGPSGLYLGPLRGNVGDLSYDLPADFPVGPGDWTVLVWCEAFTVEFVGATLTVA